MKIKTQKVFGWVITIVMVFSLSMLFTIKTWADSSFKFAIAPMYEKIILNPGDTFTGSFDVANKYDSGSPIDYEAEASCYFVDEAYNNTYNEDSAWCKIKDWITITSGEKGTLDIGDEGKIVYTINVPEDAAGGGQYAAIMVTADVEKNDTDTIEEQKKSENIDTGIKERKTIAYLLYTEITGDVSRQGEIIDINIPSFLLTGNITGSAAVKNTGNVHGDATYKLQVFPLFSDEEVYTNEEKPKTATILPDRTRYEELAWEQTPNIGIFNVIYTVEFEGVTAQVNKLVIKCPAWLLFIILFVIAALIIWIIMRIRSHNKKSAKSSSKEIE